MKDYLGFLLKKYQHIFAVREVKCQEAQEIFDGICDYYDSVIRCMPGNVYWFDRQGIAIGCNKGVLELFGFASENEFKGLTFEAMGKIGNWPKLVMESFKNDTMNVFKTGQPKFNVEEPPLVYPNGKTVYFLTSRVPVFDRDSNIIAVVGISVDITARKLMEKKLNEINNQLAQAKQNEEELRKAAMIFAGSVAHDLTTPLTNMNLMANNVSNMLPELLEIYQTIETNKKNLNETQLAYLEKFPQSLQTQLTELNEYIKDSLKALNKTVAGIKTQDDLVKCELWRHMQKVLDEYPYLENEKALIHWDTSHLFTFMGNPLLFYRIMFNLIKNSLYQIREKGRGEIFIRAEQTDTHNVLYFKDTAGSVTQETVDNIFNSYQTTKAEGTGVGLAFCKLTMQSFGGEMGCQLVEGEFIEFKLQFPTSI